MDILTWADLLQLRQGNQVLHHSGNLATVTRIRLDGDGSGHIELNFDGDSLNLLQLNTRAHLEHHVFYRWSCGWQVPKFKADQQVWRRGDEIETYHTIESISPNCLGGYSYYLTDSRALHPESCLVHRSLAT